VQISGASSIVKKASAIRAEGEFIHHLVQQFGQCASGQSAVAVSLFFPFSDHVSYPPLALAVGIQRGSTLAPFATLLLFDAPEDELFEQLDVSGG